MLTLYKRINSLHFFFFFLLIGISLGQPVSVVGQAAHELKMSTDAALLGAGGVTFGLSIPLQKKIVPLTKEEIELLDPVNIPGIDRIATRQYNARSRKISDIALRTSFALPFALLLDRHTRDEAGTAGIMYLETFLLTNGITGLFKAGVKRPRPYVYNPNADFPLKMTPNSRLSFFSGHTSNSAAFSFMTAKILTDNNPGHRMEPVIWSTAAILPAVTGLMRVKAGKHFPTDVIVGYAVGAVVGILVPALHK